MLNRLSRFVFEEHGAVTVDWTVLSAGIIAVAISAVAVVEAVTVKAGGEILTDVSVANGD